MTNELEKQFFDTFGIEPYDRYLNCTENLEVDCNRNCNCCDKAEDVYCYPEITDRILLELICVANEHENYSATTNMKNIKERTLRILLKTKKYLKDTYSHKGCHNGFVRKVRKLFEEG